MIIRDGDIEYHIRSIPLDEAQKLREQGVQFYDYTKLTAIDTCPTWGVLRYGLHKTETILTEGGRNMAVECGKTCHEYFAAIRMWTLLQRIENPGDLMVDAEHIHAHGKKLFGEARWASMLSMPQDSDPVNNAQIFAAEALHTSGYYDDPKDRKRTMANMEVACHVYATRYFQSTLPVFVKGDKIGVEIPFVLEVTRKVNGINPNYEDETAYYCGRIDGVHQYGDTIAVGENKTASRISDVWRMAFAISNQVTGYTIAASEIFNEDVTHAIVMGTQIPLPVKEPFNGISFELCTRTLSDRVRWCEWFFDGVRSYQEHLPDPTRAPRYPHSCNRFFSACQFIPFCALPREEQAQAIEAMRVDEWSPLDHLTEAATEGE